MKKVRLAVTALALSATGLVQILDSESYVRTAMLPTINDRWTYGFGSTFKEDGSPVKPNDTIDPAQAVSLARKHVAKDERGLHQCVTGPMSQVEYDILVDFSYQYGVKRTCGSSMVRHVNAGRYVDSCRAYKLYKFSGGYDCSTLIAGKPNRRCWGVWTRNLERSDKCLADQAQPE